MTEGLRAILQAACDNRDICQASPIHTGCPKDCKAVQNGAACQLVNYIDSYNNSDFWKEVEASLEQEKHKPETDFNAKAAERTRRAIQGHSGDVVEHPDHYKADNGLECIDAIEAALGDLFQGFLMGNVLKYSWRYQKKNGVEDLEKARWYLDRVLKIYGVGK